MRELCARFRSAGSSSNETSHSMALSQGAVHRPAFEVDIAEFASEPRSNGALPGARRTVNGDDKFARGGIAHSKKKNCTRWYPNTNLHEAGTRILQFAAPVADSLRVK